MSRTEPDLARFLAGEADAPTAAAVVLRLVAHPHWLASTCERVTGEVIRRVVGAAPTGPAHQFLRVAMPPGGTDDQLRGAWRRAVDALALLADTRHPWESDEREAELAELARDPLVLAGVQGAVANTEAPPLDMLGVLAIDGGDASVDALIPHLDPALVSRDVRLERLARLFRIAKPTPALDALFAEVHAALSARRDASPALALAAAIGLGAQRVFWCRFQLMSLETNELTVPRVQGHVQIDSREEPWFEVWVSSLSETPDRSRDLETRFDEARVVADGLDIGRCEPVDLPAWLASIADRLGIGWRELLLRTNVTREALQTLRAWLRPVTQRA